MHCNIHTTDAQNPLLHFSARHGCHHQGVFTVVKAVISLYAAQSHTGTRTEVMFKTQEKPSIKCWKS